MEGGTEKGGDGENRNTIGLEKGIERCQKIGFVGEESVHDDVFHGLRKMVRIDFFQQALELRKMKRRIVL